MHVCHEKDGNYVIPLDKLSLFTVKVWPNWMGI